MIASWLTLGTFFLENSGQWRIPFALQLVPAIVLIAFLFLVPESPRWLMLRDRHEDAIESLRRYLGKGLSSDDDVVQNEYKSIRGSLEIERQSKISFKTVILLPRSIVSSQAHVAGITLVENLGMSALMARILTGVNATTYCISTALAF
ncbi:hypothetical protein LTR09_009514 [Extremus antarcticus]|uniref:Major facilitator superfamily (MFS) profile domain-containing protein n=1 Tax=Extremus antarcticus TaxID=702011 RepID=A0AAJ0GBQ8_9PEZI|nr:hypothetical protein LTR09_009514 [Extremus antarcticus]